MIRSLLTQPFVDQLSLLNQAIAASLPGEIREQLISRRDRLIIDRQAWRLTGKPSRGLIQAMSMPILTTHAVGGATR